MENRAHGQNWSIYSKMIHQHMVIVLKKLRICHALKTNGRHFAFHASLMKYWHFSKNIFPKRNSSLSYEGNSLKYQPKYQLSPLRHWFIHFCASYFILVRSFSAFLRRLKHFHWVFMDALYNDERFSEAHIHRLCDQSIKSPAVPEPSISTQCVT